MSEYHISVLLQEASNALQIESGQKYIDATLGGGGHTKEILNKGGIVLGIDQDQDALDYVKENFKSQIQNHKLILAQGNFRTIGEIARKNGFEKVSGILLDIGVSGRQFEESKRGFSFIHNGPLDMRMDTSTTTTAADLVNGLYEKELVDLFTKYGEEPFAKKIAKAIGIARLQKPITTTQELADIIASAVPKIGKAHPATRVFQALRIAVNDELHVLEEALQQAVTLLLPKGRLVVISFHSLEDRIVKNTFDEFVKKGLGKIITEKPVSPSEEEIETNKKSRSAKMRVFEI